MKPSTAAVPSPRPADEDLAQQARPGHGIPSQDPNPAAQVRLNPEEAAREASSTMVGGSFIAGEVIGATLGALTAGPVGLVVGATLGGVAGALGGTALSGNVANAPPAAQPTSSTETATEQGVRLHIHDGGGQGRPLVLIHGWPLSAQAWQLQMSVLQAAGYRVVAYDRRGFGESDKPASGYGYDTLADDLQRVMDQCELDDATLVGFSMGGGEVARYIARHGQSRLHSVVFAAAVVPCLMKSADNPEGPLTPETAAEKRRSMEQDRAAYFEKFTTSFFSAHGVLLVSEAQRQEAIRLCEQSAQHAALACMDAFATTDFREDLKKVTVPTLVIHGDADAIVPFEGSGQRTHRAFGHSQLVVVPGAPHGLNVTHTEVFNEALLSFLRTARS